MEYDSVVAFTLFKMAKLLPAMGKSRYNLHYVFHTRKQVTFETIRVLFLKSKNKIKNQIKNNCD